MMLFPSTTDIIHYHFLSLWCLHLNFPPETSKNFLATKSDDNLNNTKFLLYLKNQLEFQDQTKSMHLNSVLTCNDPSLVYPIIPGFLKTEPPSVLTLTQVYCYVTLKFGH